MTRNVSVTRQIRDQSSDRAHDGGLEIERKDVPRVMLPDRPLPEQTSSHGGRRGDRTVHSQTAVTMIDNFEEGRTRRDQQMQPS